MGLSSSKPLKPTPQPFPLLCLPSIPLEEALKFLDPIELFTLSQCSKKVVGKIKLARTQTFRLSVNFHAGVVKINDKYTFKVKNNVNNNFEIGNRNFGIKDVKMTVPVATDPKDENALLCVLDDTFVGTRAIYLHLCEIFGCKVDHLFSGDNTEKLQWILGEILEKQEEIPNFNLGLTNFTDENLTWTLDTVKVTESLTSFFQPSEDFRYNFKTLPEILRIYYASWFTLDNLLSLESCVIVILDESTLTNRDLDVFMSLWKTGKYPKLEYLVVLSKYLDDKSPIAGLTIKRNIRNSIHREKRIKGGTYPIFNGVDIRRDDGIMATFEMNPEFHSLQLLVWTK